MTAEWLAEQSVQAFENVLRGFNFPLSPDQVHKLQVHMLTVDLARALAEERNRALEEAAKVCDEMQEDRGQCGLGTCLVSRGDAELIRGLISRLTEPGDVVPSS